MTARAPADAPYASGLSRRFRLAREHAKLTQRGLAAVAKCAESMISDIEGGSGRMPQIDTIEALARVLGISPGWLAYGDGVAPPDWLGVSDQTGQK